VLRPGGRLVLSDILLTRPKPDFRVPLVTIEQQLDADFAPWPDKWCALDALRAAIAASGFTIATQVDATVNTWPNYDTIAPSGSERLSGPRVMRLLHEGGYLRYVYLALAKS
jgi:hypothetical protein